MLVLLVRVLAALDRIAVGHELELGAGKGVADPADQLLGRVPVLVTQDAEELLGLGDAGRFSSRNSFVGHRKRLKRKVARVPLGCQAQGHGQKRNDSPAVVAKSDLARAREDGDHPPELGMSVDEELV